MLTLGIVVGLCLVLSFLLRKKFGIPVLGLAVGTILSDRWSHYITLVVGPYLGAYQAYIAPIIIVLPAILLVLFSKARTRKQLSKLINAVLFAGTAGLLVLPSIAPGDLPGAITSVAAKYTVPITSAIFCLAVLQVAFSKAKKKPVEETPPTK